MRRILERAFNKFNNRGWFKWVSDERCLKILYHLYLGKRLDLKNPKTFNEKLQWLKLYDRNPQYTRMVDKWDAKNYISEKIGEKYIIPTLGVWENFDDIDFDVLPKQFVLKCTHDSGSIVIVKDKDKFDKKAARKKLQKGLKREMFYTGREWPYKNVPRRIIAEKYMIEDASQKESVLTDYKFFCFEGEAKIMYASKDKAEEPATDFYDMEGTRLNMRMKDPNSKDGIPLPKNFEKMKEIATLLSQGVHHLRVDFYECDGEIYVGELTFYHCSGFAKIHPEEWEQTLGAWIRLPIEGSAGKEK